MMTTENRPAVPDSIHTNGATPNPWWSNAVVYQIYPRSFQDSNNDGYGDIPGIISRLDYLKDLGVDVLWLSPVYKSPQMDNGYDISDYEQIDPKSGTWEDMDELFRQAHARGLKVIMDLVVNHTSDEHPWFQASRNADDPHADWYWWRPARPGHKPGTPGAEPNQWGSYFGGSAWTYDPKRGEYYLHQYSAKQPDLNWENPAVRKAVYAMMNRWMDRGIDGFRMDVITQISKVVDKNGKLPGEPGSQIADNPTGPDGYSSPFPFCSDGPRIDEFLQEMRKNVFDGRHGYLTVGEAPGVSGKRQEEITNPANHELDMLFVFTHLDDPKGRSKWDAPAQSPLDLKKSLGLQQEVVRKDGWTSLFFDNHDQPRMVSRFGDDSTDALRIKSAKALALLLHLHRGTPYIYEGEELGMTNRHFTSLDQLRDLESINLYHQRIDSGQSTPAEMMASINRVGRDNARTPMQWDDSTYAGFEDADALDKGGQEPWLGVNPNKDHINVAAEEKDPHSVLNFYKELINLRHHDLIVSAGDFEYVDREDPHVYAFTRSLDDWTDSDGVQHRGGTYLVMVNMHSRESLISRQILARAEGHVGPTHIVISTYDDNTQAAFSILQHHLDPWEGLVLDISK
jgi:oligo-1,6-glucosidase